MLQKASTMDNFTKKKEKVNNGGKSNEKLDYLTVSVAFQHFHNE